MADVAGIAGRAVEQTAVDDDPAAHSGGHDHPDVVGLPRGGAEPSLGDSERLGVVVHDRPEAGVLGDAPPERELAPLRDVQRRYRFATGRHGPAAPDSTRDHAVPVPLCEGPRLVEQR